MNTQQSSKRVHESNHTTQLTQHIWIHLLSAFLCCLPSLLHVLLVLAVINNVVKVTPP